MTPSKSLKKRIDIASEVEKSTDKPNINFVVIGHVDAGKSTLMGRLLFDSGAIDDRTIQKYKRDSQNIGKASFAFAWAFDQTEEERARYDNVHDQANVVVVLPLTLP